MCRGGSNEKRVKYTLTFYPSSMARINAPLRRNERAQLTLAYPQSGNMTEENITSQDVTKLSLLFWRYL